MKRLWTVTPLFCIDRGLVCRYFPLVVKPVLRIAYASGRRGTRAHVFERVYSFGGILQTVFCQYGPKARYNSKIRITPSTKPIAGHTKITWSLLIHAIRSILMNTIHIVLGSAWKRPLHLNVAFVAFKSLRH